MSVLLLLSTLSSVTALATASNEAKQTGMYMQVGMSTKTRLYADNPIRKVIRTMEQMRDQTESLQKEDDEVYGEVKCKCDAEITRLQKIVDDMYLTIRKLEDYIKELKAKKLRLEGEIREKYKLLREAERILAEAKALREHEAVMYANMIGDYGQNLLAIEAAVQMLYKGLGQNRGLDKEFLQTGSAHTLRNMVETLDMSDQDRDAMTSFLGQREDSGQPTTTSSEIIGILKQMHDTMVKDLANTKRLEKESKKRWEEIKYIKEKEIDELREWLLARKSLWASTCREILEKERELEDLKENGYRRAKKALDDMIADCTAKATAYEKRTKERNLERAALTKAIQLLNTDEHLAIFKRTLKDHLSFLQQEVKAQEVMRRAHDTLTSQRRRDWRIDLIALSMHGGKAVDFKKILKKIEDMIVLLGKQQATDDSKKKLCDADLKERYDNKAEYQKEVTYYKAQVASDQSDFDSNVELLGELNQEISDLDYSVVEAGESRKKENSLYEKELQDNEKSVSLLKGAKQTLDEVYNREDGDRFAEFAQVNGSHSRHSSHKEIPPVVGVFGQLIADLKMEMRDNKIQEDRMQLDYKFVMDDAKERRKNMMLRKEQLDIAKAMAEGRLRKSRSGFTTYSWRLQQNDDMLKSLHLECDWLVKNYQTREYARTSEISSLKSAADTLRGANVDFLQEGQTQNHVHGLLRGR